MGKLIIDQTKVNEKVIKDLVNICPFNAMENNNGKLQINAGCKMCRLCVKKGPKDIVKFVENDVESIDKSLWKGIAVYVEHTEEGIHPITLELIGKAKELSKSVNFPVYCVFIGYNIRNKAKELLYYGVDEVFVYDYKELEQFRIEPYTLVFEDFINKIKPSAILIGATNIGRSLAPRVAARFRTGLTADCIALKMKNNTDLVQVRPAFGGNIMAQIICPNARPQMATVRYKIMNPAKRQRIISGKVTLCNINSLKLKSRIDVLEIINKPKNKKISDSEIVIIASRAIREKNDLKMVQDLAKLLGAKVAGTRPLVEAGWIKSKDLIGLSGKIIKPKLVISLGASGAIQFTAGISSSEYIVAINTDKNAPIFNIAHYGIIGDIYEIVPQLIKNLRKTKKA